jgi:nucleoid DNA-binding protein
MGTASRKAPHCDWSRRALMTPVPPTPWPLPGRRCPLPLRRSAARKAAHPAPAPKTASTAKPIKAAFTKAGLTACLAEQAAVDKKAVQAALAVLEGAVLGSGHRKGVGEVSLPGLVKIGVQQVPAKKKRFDKDPFTGEERWFDAKPAGVRIKARPLKKLRDAVA